VDIEFALEQRAEVACAYLNARYLRHGASFVPSSVIGLQSDTGDAALLDNGGVEGVMRCMRRHTGDLNVQALAVATFRNMASKSGAPVASFRCCLLATAVFPPT
jgi:hypothetical protein